jgi:16S rRNA processing protein RimM
LSKVSPENLLLVGKVIRPHGLGGLLRIRSYAHSEESFLNAGTVFLKSDQQELLEYRVLSAKPHKNILLMSLEEISSLEEAEKYRGNEIFINKDSLNREREDEHFWFELIGLKVYLNNGRYIGRLKEILSTPGNDIYVVRKEDSEFFIPAVHEVIEVIDLENMEMIISEIEGLLDINEV